MTAAGERPKLLDLFCKAGGAGMGYHRAGFDVTGVDIEPQKHYPFEFIQADALTFPLDGFDAIHASPPCQAFSVMKVLKNAKPHPNLVEPIRKRLSRNGRPWVIENVPGAPMPMAFTLCGSMFGLRSSPQRYLRRHRLFESSEFILAPRCHHRGLAVGVYGHGSAGFLGQRMRTALVDEARVLMGIDWMNRDELSQAIPPAYTEFIGKQLLASLRQAQP